MTDPQYDHLDSPFQQLPAAVDHMGEEHPNKLWFKIPRDSDLTQGWRDLTYRELSHAVNGMAHWIESKFGRGRRNVDVVAYIGLNDILYCVAEVALLKAGYMILLPSPRNMKAGQESLFKETGCSILIHSGGVDQFINPIKDAFPNLRTAETPTFDGLAENGSKEGRFVGVPCTQEDRVVIIHTSGSTGYPKPIYNTHGSIYTNVALKNVTAPEGRTMAYTPLAQSDDLMLSPAPLFHAMGQTTFWCSVLLGGPLVMLPANKPPTGDLIVKAILQTRPITALIPPSLIEHIADTPGGVEALRSLEHVFYGGGPLSASIGDKVSKVTKLVTMIGSTEAGVILNVIAEDRADWNYFEWAPESGVVMEPDSDSLYEMVIKPRDKQYQAVFHTFPDIKEWRTKDLFQEHPKKKGLWLYKGRKDDVLVLSNGEKFNPVDFEKTMEGHALVKGAVVVGQARFQAGLLIEPEWTFVPADQDPEAFLDSIWPLIEQANAMVPAHGKVWKSKVAIAKKDKPFIRAGKGSIIRRRTVTLYEKEIDALYANETTDEELGKLPADADIPSTKSFLRQLLELKGIELPDSTEADEVDFFSFGMDSLQVLGLSSTLSHSTGGTVSPRVIYSNPTINALAQILRGSHTNGANHSTREDAMARMVEKYTHNLPRQVGTANRCGPSKHTYILTGSTGSLGNYTLQELLLSPDVEHVFCLNRSADAEERQKKTFAARGLEKVDWSRATFLTTDFSQDHFGLSEHAYETLLHSVDIFIHNAWAVNFDLTLQSYEKTHVAGIRRVVDFSLKSKHRAPIVFISSIAEVAGHSALHPAENMVPEELCKEYGAALPQGYGESKHVASRILGHAAAEAGVSVTIVRAGQLAGPVGPGAPWNKHEWLPSIVITSKALGMVPNSLGNQNNVDWVPMDLAAKSVVDICNSRAAEQTPLAVAHLFNPRSSSWEDLVPAVKESLEEEVDKSIEIVSFRDWLAALKSSPQTPEEIAKKPGIKLLGFYEGLLKEGAGLPSLATTKTRAMSKTVDELKSVDADLMRKWVGQWADQ